MMIRQIKAPFFKTITHKGMLATVISYSLTLGRMRYAPTVGGENLQKKTPTKANSDEQMVNM